MLPQIAMTGRLTEDPELRFTPSGTAVANLRVAANDRVKNNAGEWKDAERIFVNVAIWESDAEAVAETLRKGDEVTVTGRLYEREYETRDGSKGKSLEVKFPTLAKAVKARRSASGDRPAPQRQQPAEQPWGSSSAPAEPPF